GSPDLVNHRALAGIRLLGDVTAGDNLRNGQLKLGGELIVTGIVRRNGHNRASTVTHQHVVTNEDRNLLAIDRVGRISTDKDTGLFLILLALQDRKSTRLNSSHV